jgi:putative membrane protein
MRRFPVSVLLLLVALPSGACRERETVSGLTGTTTVHRGEERTELPESTSLMPPVDRDQFVTQAIAGGFAEIELGELAAEKGDSPEVRQFGEMMVDYHREATERMLQIVREREIEAPSGSNDAHSLHVTRLGRLRDAEFDRQYIQQVIENHQSSTELFRRASESAINPELRQFATESLPVREDHFERALAIQAELRSAKAAMRERE